MGCATAQGEGAAIGVLITMEEPIQPMQVDATFKRAEKVTGRKGRQLGLRNKEKNVAEILMHLFE